MTTNQNLSVLEPLRPAADWWPVANNWDWTARHKWTQSVSWFIPTLETVTVLAQLLKGKRVIEPGAGTGYLAAHLRHLGVTDYNAVDSQESHFEPGIVTYGIVVDDAVNHINGSYDAVVLTWPSYNTPFGANVVRRMVPGQVLYYQGESEGGCTGDDEMFALLYEHFEELEEQSALLNEHHVQFDGIHDYWTVYRRIGTPRLTNTPVLQLGHDKGE